MKVLLGQMLRILLRWAKKCVQGLVKKSLNLGPLQKYHHYEIFHKCVSKSDIHYKLVSDSMPSLLEQNPGDKVSISAMNLMQPESCVPPRARN